MTQLTAPSETPISGYVLRPHRPGDMGWVVMQHGLIYCAGYGWDARFEALTAELVAGFLQNFDLARERCWIAERNGERIGCVFLVRQSETVAKLRMLVVTPEARGLGLGKRLVREVIEFARETGYEKLTLWTNDVLIAAREIYRGFGFQLVESKPHHDFGVALTGETWELSL